MAVSNSMEFMPKEPSPCSTITWMGLSPSFLWDVLAHPGSQSDASVRFSLIAYRGRDRSLALVGESARHGARVPEPEACVEIHRVFRGSKRSPAPSVSQYQ